MANASKASSELACQQSTHKRLRRFGDPRTFTFATAGVVDEQATDTQSDYLACSVSIERVVVVTAPQFFDQVGDVGRVSALRLTITPHHIRGQC